MTGAKERESKSLVELAQCVQKLTKDASWDNPVPTPISGLTLLRSNQVNRPGNCLIKAALYVTLQGAKWSTFGAKRYKFGPGQALVVAVDVPSRGTVSVASARKPYLGLQVELDFAILQDVAEELAASQAKKANLNAKGALILDLSDQLILCLHHAIRLLETPEAIPMLYPGIMRELCYWLLTGAAAEQIGILTRIANSHDQRMTRAIAALRSNLKEPIQVVNLARSANMTPVTFHRNFKAVTGVSPLQYQKQLRLHEARRLLIFSSAKVESAALAVGYASISQFSREYTRLFGNSPRKDAFSWKRFQAVVD